MRRTWTSKFQDYHFLLWSNCRVPTFENWFRKSRTTRTDMLFNEIYDRINHLTPSVKNQNKWSMKLGNIELCELLDMEPKTQCKVCLSYWDIGIVCCTCGHFLRKGTEEKKNFVQYTMDLLSIPNYNIKKGRHHGHRHGKKPGDREYYIANPLKKKCKKEELLGYPRPIHTRRKVPQEHDWQRSNSKKFCRQMDDLADEDHTHHLTSRRNWRLHT